MRPWLQDPDGDGTYTWSTDQIPAGTYEFKVAHGLNWDENYGDGGEQRGAVRAVGRRRRDHPLRRWPPTCSARRCPQPGAAPDLNKAKAIWVEPGPAGLARHARCRQAPTRAAARWRLHWSPDGRPGGRRRGRHRRLGGGPDLRRRRAARRGRRRAPELKGYLALRLLGHGRSQAGGHPARPGRGRRCTTRRRAPRRHRGADRRRPGRPVCRQGQHRDVRRHFGGAAPAYRLWAPTAQKVGPAAWSPTGQRTRRRRRRRARRCSGQPTARGRRPRLGSGTRATSTRSRCTRRPPARSRPTWSPTRTRSP